MQLSDIPILTYHKVSNKIGWGVTTVPVRFFYQQMQFLHENGFSSLSLADFSNEHFATTDLSRKIIITFDDADLSVYENAFPIMKQFGFVGTVFVITDYVGKADTWDANPFGSYSRLMEWAHLRELVDQGWTIGSHTASHADLTALNEQQLWNELRRSKELLENKLAIEISAISYPFNRFNRRVLAAALRAGYEYGFILGKTRIAEERFQQLLVPRLGVYLFDGGWMFKSKICKNALAFQLQNIISRFSKGSIMWKRLFH